MAVHKLTVPIRLAQSAKKTITLSLNQYRNMHFRTNNAMKKRYKDLVQPEVSQLPVMDRVSLTYVIYPPNNRNVDVSNIAAHVDKYFMDAVVELGRLPDDNYKHVPEVIYQFGAIDKINPRVEVFIKELTC